MPKRLLTPHKLKPLTLALMGLMYGVSHAALFNPASGSTEYDQELHLVSSGDDTSQIAIIFSGGNDAKPVVFNFKENVQININQGTGNNDNWSAYGVWVSNSALGSALVTFNKGLDVDIKDISNLGIGIISGTAWNPVGGSQGKDNGTTLTFNGPVSVDIEGNSVTAVVAGSHFNNNTNPGGKIVFNSGDESNQKNIFNIKSDWSDEFNSDRNSDWAVGLLSFDKGEMIVDRDTEINLDIVNFRTTYTSDGQSYESDEYKDIAAAIYVDNESSFELKENRELKISVKSKNPNITSGGSFGKPNAAAPSFGIAAGAHEAAYDATTNSSIKLNGNTIVDLYIDPQAEKQQQSVMTGIGVFGGAELITKAPVTINIKLAEGNSAQDLTYSDKNAYGIWAGAYPSTALVNLKGSGYIEINDALTINLPEGINPAIENFIALRASGYSVDKSTSKLEIDNTESHAPVNINGRIYAEDRGYIQLSLDGAQSSITSNISIEERSKHNGSVDMTLSGGAIWNALEVTYNPDKPNASDNSPENVLNILRLNNGATLNISRPDHLSSFPLIYGGYESVRVISTFAINDGNIIFDTDITENEVEGIGNTHPSTDQVILKGDTSGTGAVQVKFKPGKVPDKKFHSLNWLISQQNGSMTLTGPNGTTAFSGRGMVSLWSLAFVPEGQESLLNTEEGRNSLSNTSNGAGNWYLIRKDQWVDDPEPEPKPEPDPSPNPDPTPEQPDDPQPEPTPDPVLPPEIEQNITIGTSTSQALAYMADLEDLRKRIGEVRYGAQDGLWAKAFTKQDSVDGHHGRGFEQETYGINIGFDRLVGTNEASTWLLGAAFRYGTSDQEGLGVAGASTGELDEYSVKAYATWMHDSGSYADFVLQAGRYEQELNGVDNTGLGSSHADYHTYGYGASIEVGHMFSIANGEDDRPWFNHWFIEPQFELSYFRALGADYHTSTGMKVEQDDADFLTGRAGVVIGKKFNYGSVNDLDKRYFQIAAIGGVKHEFLGGDQTIHYQGVDQVRASVKADDIAGTRAYYGVNMDWQLTQNLRLYGEVSREEGDGYTKDYDVSVGLKYNF